MATDNHYSTLQVSPSATQAEIKQAYRRLAKLFHPDGNQDTASHEKIARVNAAYEILGDPQNRQFYDRQLRFGERKSPQDASSSPRRNRQQRTAAAQAHHRRSQKTGRQRDEEIQRWLEQVYTPVNRLISEILLPLKDQIDDLAADPFDDELIQDFQDYLDDCRDWLAQAERIFRSQPNPPNVAGAAASLFYCLNQVDDGIEQLAFFTHSYDDDYLHTGQEMFRIAAGLRREAQAAIRAVVS
jgi:molecular chaperone DnaJ